MAVPLESESPPAAPAGSPAPRRLPHRLGLRGWVYAGRYPVERYLYVLHRIAGLGLVLYLPLHVWVTSARLQGAEAWERTMTLLSSPLFRAGEWLVLAAFAFHGLNGLRLLLGHLGLTLGRPAEPVYPYPIALRRQRPLTVVLMLVAAATMAVGLWEIVVR